MERGLRIYMNCFFKALSKIMCAKNFDIALTFICHFQSQCNFFSFLLPGILKCLGFRKV